MLTNFEQIQKLYIAYLQRASDPGGLIYWTKRFEETGDLTDIARAFFYSDEFRSVVGDPDPKNLILTVYRSCFSREVDPQGFSFWLQAVNEGVVPIELLPLAIVEGARSGNDFLAMSNKITSAMNFVKVLDPELDGKETLANFSGEKDILFAKRFVAFVNSDPRTVLDSEDAEIFISSRIADPNDPILKKLSSRTENLLKVAETKSLKNYTIDNLPSKEDPKIASLLSGFSWNKKEITYSFGLAESPIYEEAKPLSLLEKEIVRMAFDRISSLVDLKFKEVSYGGDIQFCSATLPKGIGGVTSYRVSENSFLRPVVIYLSNLLQLNESSYFIEKDWGFSGFGVVLIYHEICHALGLKHPYEAYPVIEQGFDKIPWTIMGYAQGRTYTPVLKVLENECQIGIRYDAIPDGIGLLDLDALISVYGPNLESGKDDDIYALREGENYYRIIWDPGGKDVIDASNIKGPSIINLEDGTLSTVGLRSIDSQTEELISGISHTNLEYLRSQIMEYLKEIDSRGLLFTGEGSLGIAKGCVIEDVRTGSGDDVVYDNRFDNFIELNGGNDIAILGSGGFDVVLGGEGYDILILPYEKKACSMCANPEFVIITHDKLVVKAIGFEEIHFADDWILV